MLVRILVIGDFNVGKTTLISALCHDSWVQAYQRFYDPAWSQESVSNLNSKTYYEEPESTDYITLRTHHYDTPMGHFDVQWSEVGNRVLYLKDIQGYCERAHVILVLTDPEINRQLRAHRKYEYFKRNFPSALIFLVETKIDLYEQRPKPYELESTPIYNHKYLKKLQELKRKASFVRLSVRQNKNLDSFLNLLLRTTQNYQQELNASL